MLAFMITRDRLSYARRCSTALMRAGLEVVVVDHGSTYPPMVRWLEWMGRYSTTTVVRMPNQHPRDLWGAGNVLERHVPVGERFVVSDCDVVPDPDCPAGWVAHLGALLDRLPSAKKAGLGLRTDNLPRHFAGRDRVIEWESQYQAVTDGGKLNYMPGDGAATVADVDTTLAMYRGLEPFALGPSLRTRLPYRALHLPWYENTAQPTDEQAYYAAHAEHGHWRAPDGYIDRHNLGGNHEVP